MATTPSFANVVNLGSNVVSASADSSYTAPTHTVTIVTAGTNGTKIEEVDFVGTGATLAGCVALYLYDGSAYHYFDTIVVSVVTPSSTQAPFRITNVYPNLILKTGWSLVATSFVASQLINILAFGGDY